MSEAATKQEGVSACVDLDALDKLVEDLFNLMGEVTYKRTEEEDPALKCTAIFYAGMRLVAMHALLAVRNRTHRWEASDLEVMNSFLEMLSAPYLDSVTGMCRRMGLLGPAKEEAGDGSAEG